MDCYLVQHKFDKICNQHPKKVAIYFQDTGETYEDLYVFSNKMARSLRRKGVKRGDRIAIMMPKSISAVKAMLGILKADACYVPIDCKAPLERINEILDDCSPAGIVIDEATYSKLGLTLFGDKKSRGVWLIRDGEGRDEGRVVIGENEIFSEKADEPAYTNIDRDIAYIIYTSGSTGKPKGVMISHKNVYNYINWATSYFGINDSDNILNTSHFYYDMSVFDIYCAMHTGATITIVPEGALLFPVRIMDTVEKRRCTIWKGVSSLLGYCVKCNSLNRERIGTLKKVIFSGEPLSQKYLLEWIKTYPNKEFFNAYGPTECTGISACYRVEKEEINAESAIPIGWACTNTEMYALDREGRETPVGEIGELHIRGSSVGAGYWNDQNKTNECFVRSPLNKTFDEIVYRTGDYVKQLADGKFVFVGRKDSQVKVMGYRIELGEIECALQGVKGVREAVVVTGNVIGDEDGGIVAVLETDREVRIDDIRVILSNKLPKYMIPRKMHIVNEIKRLDNGKVDRQYIKKCFIDGE